MYGSTTAVRSGFFSIHFFRHQLLLRGYASTPRYMLDPKNENRTEQIQRGKKTVIGKILCPPKMVDLGILSV